MDFSQVINCNFQTVNVPAIQAPLTIPYDDSLRQTVRKMGHSSEFLKKLMTPKNIKTVVFLITMAYWPYDRISRRQLETITSCLISVGNKTIKQDIKPIDTNFDWATYHSWSLEVRNRIAAPFNGTISISDEDLPFNI